MMTKEHETQLTVEDYEAINKEAFQNWRKHLFRVKGQTVMREDGIEWHVMKATEKYLAEKGIQQLPKITATFECVQHFPNEKLNTITGSTNCPVKRVEVHDDHTLEVILDYWPEHERLMGLKDKSVKEHLSGALRQYRHNDGNGFVNAYDRKEIDELFGEIE